MIRALYTASSGLVASTIKQDVIANNIANVDTPGYQKQFVTNYSFSNTLTRRMATLFRKEQPPYPDPVVQPTIVRAEDEPDWSRREIKSTGRSMDFAIVGPGSFEVQAADGPKYTRRGVFHVDYQGELAALDGNKVMGQSGPVQIPNADVRIDADGYVYADGRQIDQIKIVGGKPGITEVWQEHIEELDSETIPDPVNIVDEMVQMIANQRQYDANQKVVHAVDDSLAKLINEGSKA